MLPASEFMVDFMFRLQRLLSEDGKDFAVLFLSYGNLSFPIPYPSLYRAGLRCGERELIEHDRCRPRITIPPSINPSSHTPPPSHHNPFPLPIHHLPLRRLSRRQPSPLPLVPHLASPPQYLHPASESLLQPRRCNFDFTMARFRHVCSRRSFRHQGLDRTRHREEMASSLPRSSSIRQL